MKHATSVVLRFSFLGIVLALAACASNGSALAPQAAAPPAFSKQSGDAGPLGSQQILLVGKRWQAPWNLAVDRGGNVFVTDLPTGKLFKVSPPFTGPTHGRIDEVGVYYWYPWGIAVDNDDDAYVSEGAFYVGWFVLQVRPSGLTSIVARGPYFTGLAVDTQKNVYAAADTSVIYRIAHKSVGGWQIPVRYGPTFEEATSVAVDASRDVYVTDSDANQVVMIEPGSQKKVLVGSGYWYPASVAVDRYCKTSCPVYVADTLNSEIKMITPPFTGSTHGKITVVGYGFRDPWGVAVKGNDVYVADTHHHLVKEIVP